MNKLSTYSLILSLLFALSITRQAFPKETFSRESAVVLAVRKVSPAVVNISSTQVIQERFSPFSPFSGDSLFEEFFRDFLPGYQREYAQTSLGSGVVVDGAQGFILTNQHVIEGTSQIMVTLTDNREFEAEVIGSDPDSDIAILKINAKESLPSIEMGDSDNIMIGESVIAIGNPFGLSHTVTTGVISALHRSVKAQKQVYNDLIQTDTSINPGNSGGPLLNINGDLIGINTAIYSRAQGIGFAIPINKARRILDDLIRYGEVHPAWIGVEVKNASIKGALVNDVIPRGPADKAGLGAGDVVVAVNKRPVESKQDFEDCLSDFTAGDKITITYYRNGHRKQAILNAEEFPLHLVDEWIYKRLGIRITGVNKINRKRYRLTSTNGVVISGLRPGSYLESIGLRKGDMICRINDMDINNVSDFRKAIVKYRRSSAITLLVVRGQVGYYVTLKL